MLFGGRMLAGVPILGIVTAADVAAGSAESQVHPGITARQALYASIAGRGDPPDAVQMLAVLVGLRHGSKIAFQAATAPWISGHRRKM